MTEQEFNRRAIVDKINALLDEECSWGTDRAGDGFKGVARFFE